jgi:hypothetical protein
MMNEIEIPAYEQIQTDQPAEAARSSPISEKTLDLFSNGLYGVVDTAVECVTPHCVTTERSLENALDTGSLFSSQDFRQKMNMTFNVTVELYRVLVSSLLIAFVPQNCNGQICTIGDNLHYEDRKYFVGLIFNFFTMFCFIILYGIEIRREEKLIKLLEVNNTISTDNESVGKRLAKLDVEKQNVLFVIHKYYRYTAYVATVVFAVNSGLSANIIQKYSLGNQTMFNLITNVLFMISKVTNSWLISNTDKNVFLSAYLNTKVQFNDLDPREYDKIRKRDMLRQIEETGGRVLMERQIHLVEGGGFVVDIDECIDGI